MSRMGEVYDPAFPTADDDEVILKDSQTISESSQTHLETCPPPPQPQAVVVNSSSQSQTLLQDSAADCSLQTNNSGLNIVASLEKLGEEKVDLGTETSDAVPLTPELETTESVKSSPVIEDSVEVTSPAEEMRKTRRNSSQPAKDADSTTKATKATTPKTKTAKNASTNNVKSRGAKVNHHSLTNENSLKEVEVAVAEVQKAPKRTAKGKVMEKEVELPSPPSPAQQEVAEENCAEGSDKMEEDNQQTAEINNVDSTVQAEQTTDSPKKKAKPQKEEETKVPTRRSTRIKQKEKKESPAPKKATKKKEKEPVTEDIPKKEQNKAPKKAEERRKAKEKKVVEEEKEKVEEVEPDAIKEEAESPQTNHVEEEIPMEEVKEEQTKKEESEAVKESDQDQGSPPVPEPEPMEIDIQEKEQIQLEAKEAVEKQEIEEEDVKDMAPPVPVVAEAAPVSSTSSPTPAEESTEVAPAKPVKVKSRWWRNSELEQSDPSVVTTPDQMSPPLKEIPLPSAPPLVSYGRDFPHYEQIEENICLFERKRSKGKKEVRRMLCDCSLTKEEKERRETGCGDDCLNRLLMIECGSRCTTGELCANKRFQMKKYAPVEPFKTNKKGWGLRAKESIQMGHFVIEYVGEIVDLPEFRQRVKHYSREHQAHHYFMALKSDEIIDATNRGNLSRFINHSCDPNCETQKWTVNGELRIGFFTTRRVPAGEELTFDYQFQRYGREAQRCFCEASSCRGYIGLDSQVDLKSYKSSKELKKKKDKKELEDLIMEEEIERLSGGLRTREQTLTLARLMVRAEEEETRLRLLDILQSTGEQACLRLFLDYHGLSLLWSWMVAGSPGLELKSRLLGTLQLLPVPHKTMLIDSRVMDVVQRWARPCGDDDELAATASTILASWVDLKEIFRIPRLEKQKRREDERELDRRTREYNRRRRSHSRERERDRDRDHRRSYSPVDSHRYSRDSSRRDRRDHDRRDSEYSEWRDSPRKHKNSSSSSGYKRTRDSRNSDDDYSTPKKKSSVAQPDPSPQLSKEERRHRFAMEVQQKEEEEAALRKTQEFNSQLPPTDIPPPFSQQPPQILQTPPPQQQDQQPFFPYPPPPFDPTMPPPVPGQYLPPPSVDQPPLTLVPPPTVPTTNMPPPPTFTVPPPFMEPPRPPGGMFFAQPPTAPSMPPPVANPTTLPPPPQVSTLLPSAPPPSSYAPPSPAPSPYPGQSSFYLIPPPAADPTLLRYSAPPYTGKLPPHWKRAKDEDGNIYYYHTQSREAQWEVPEWDMGAEEQKPSSRKQRSTTTAAADTSSEVAKKIKELFRTKMSSHIVQCLNPFRKLDCKVGRITSTEDFKHLARKLTHFVMSKELKHCKAVEDLECNDNVKHKAKDFVHKYMAKYGAIYRKDKSPPPQEDE